MEESFSEIAALIGDKTRAKMLWSLLDGRAYTATEIAIFADISKQSCSNHLLKLVNGAILKVEKQGRHRYYRFADDKIAQVIESIAYLLPSQDHLTKTNKTDDRGIKYARTCYDHLAGKIGVKIAMAMLEMDILTNQGDVFTITDNGINWFDDLGIDLNLLLKKKRKFAYPCLDWSERKFHLGGALGAALLDCMLENDWIRRKTDTRAIIVTAKGKSELRRTLKLDISMS